MRHDVDIVAVPEQAVLVLRALDEARRALGYAAAGPTTEVYVGAGRGTAAGVTDVRLPYARWRGALRCGTW